MFKKFVLATVAASLMVGSANAASLNDADKSYIAVASGVALVISNCDAYTPVPGSLIKVKDRLGVSNEVPTAMLTALKMFADADYDRDDLNPAVTRNTKATLDALSKDLSKSKKKFCDTYGKVLVDGGLFTKSSKL